MKKKELKVKSKSLEIVNPHSCGIDIGSRSHWVCVSPASGISNSVCEFKTDTQSLIELTDYLTEHKITTVAMESTGVYWIPVFELLSTKGFEVILADARVISKVPGRKTDVLDCQWIQQLHAYGLLQGAYRPDDEIIKFRALVRMKKTLISQRSDWLRRIQKELEQMNIRVHRAVSDITGVTGMRILDAIVKGERNPAKLAEFRDVRCAKDKAQIERELTGNWRAEHLFNLRIAFDSYLYFSNCIDKVRNEIFALLRNLSKVAGRENAPVPKPEKISKAKIMKKRDQEATREDLYRFCGYDLTRIDGISTNTAEVVLSEIGYDVSKFPTEKHFISYLRISPSMAVSGGRKVRSKKKTSYGACRVKDALKMAAASLRQSKTAIGSYYRSIAYRKGAAVAVFATARKLAGYIYRMLRYGKDYIDIGIEAYEKRCRLKRINSLKSNAKSLGINIDNLINTRTTA